MAAHHRAVHVGHDGPVGKAPLYLACGLEPDDGAQLRGVPARQLEHDGAAHRASEHDGMLETERTNKGHDHVGVESGGEQIFLLPPDPLAASTGHGRAGRRRSHATALRPPRRRAGACIALSRHPPCASTRAACPRQLPRSRCGCGPPQYLEVYIAPHYRVELRHELTHQARDLEEPAPGRAGGARRSCGRLLWRTRGRGCSSPAGRSRTAAAPAGEKFASPPVSHAASHSRR